MKNKAVATIVCVSLAAAVGGIAFGVKATNDRNAALEEIRSLRDALSVGDTSAALSTDQSLESTPLVALKDVAEISTNDLAEVLEQLAAREAELARLRAERAARENRPSFQERMAQLQAEDPERYAEMIQQRTERQEQMRYNQASRLAIFTEMDTSGMSEEELANHNKLMEKLTVLWAATGEFDPENPPDWRAIRESVGDLHEIGQMMDLERTYMLKQLGADVGLTGTDSQEFAAYVEDIVGATSMRMPRGMRGGGRDRGPDREQ